MFFALPRWLIHLHHRDELSRSQRFRTGQSIALLTGFHRLHTCDTCAAGGLGTVDGHMQPIRPRHCISRFGARWARRQSTHGTVHSRDSLPIFPSVLLTDRSRFQHLHNSFSSLRWPLGLGNYENRERTQPVSRIPQKEKKNGFSPKQHKLQRL